MTSTPPPPLGPDCVVLLNDYCYVQGGASRVAVDEAVALAQSGCEVIFVGAKGPVCAELAEAPLTVVDLDQPELTDAGRSPLVVLQGLWNAKAGRALAEVLRGRDPARTVVHLHGYTKSLTTAPVRVATRLGFPVVCTLHDFFAACPNGAFFDYVENRPCERKALSPACLAANCDKRHRGHKIYRVIRSLVQREFGHFPGGVDTYVSLSRRSQAILAPYLPADAAFHPLPNIIPMEHRPPAVLSLDKAVVAVGRLDREKGIESLLEASSRTGVPITFVGDGPLRSAAEATPGCRVTGWVGAAEVTAALDEARALVFPSLWYETFGLVVSEAAARGVPAIVSDVSAASERVRPGETGWVFPAGNVDVLADCLRATLDIDTVARFGRRAFDEFWADPPDRAHHTTALLDIYAATLARRGGESRGPVA